MKHLLIFLFCILIVGFAMNECLSETKWAKGNLHAHTTLSDGDTSPQEVADWYKEHGYQFLMISDHWKLGDPTKLTAGEGFVLLTGEETAIRNASKGIHANAIGSTRLVDPPQMLMDRGKTLAVLVERIRKAGGIPMINHPNFQWSFGHRELMMVKDPYLLEVFNGHPIVNNYGNAAFLPVEQTWDILLSNGKTVYATATDDAHNLKNFTPQHANPGRGWVVARVSELTPKAILESLGKGDFYASTGVELADYVFDGRELKVKVAPKDGRTYTIRFMGKWGRILHETDALEAAYRFTGKPEKDEYVRCKVISDDATAAWTQAFRIKDR